MQYLSARGPEVPISNDDLIQNDEPYCSHPLCTPPTKRKNIFATATKQIKNNIKSFIPSLRKGNEKDESTKKSSVKVASKNSKPDHLQPMFLNESKRRPLSVSAPASVQNTPRLRHKRSREVDITALDTTNIFKPVQMKNENDISIHPIDSIKPNNNEECKKSLRAESRNSYSSGKYAISSIKKGSVDSKNELPDVKAADIKFADYIQHRKSSQKKLAPPSPRQGRSSPKQRKSSRHKNLEGQKSVESTSTWTSSQTSPRIITKNPCHWTTDATNVNNLPRNSKPSLSTPATPLFNRRTVKNEKELDMQTKADLKELCKVGSTAKSNVALFPTRNSDKLSKDFGSNGNIDINTIPPLSPIPRRRNVSVRSKSSHNFSSKPEKTGQTGVATHQMANFSCNGISINSTKDHISFESGRGANISINDKTVLAGGKITSEPIDVNQDEMKSLPCTPFQTRKSSRNPKLSFDMQQYKPLNYVLDSCEMFPDEENKSHLYSQKSSNDPINASGYANAMSVSTSPRLRKRNSTLSPEQIYREQRRSESKQPNLVVSQPRTPPTCRRVSKTVLTASPQYDISCGTVNDDLKNANGMAHLEMKKIYLFVSDAQTQTEGIGSIYGSHPVVIQSTEIDKIAELGERHSSIVLDHDTQDSTLENFQNINPGIDSEIKTLAENEMNENEHQSSSPKCPSLEIISHRNSEVTSTSEIYNQIGNFHSSTNSAFKPVKEDAIFGETR